MVSLAGRRVLVTGGSRGIGAASAILLARSGADVGIVYSRDAVAAGKVVDGIERAGRTGIAVRGDVRRYADCTRAVKTVQKWIGPVDILVNSAGIWEEGPIGTLTPERWKRTLEINLGGTINMIRAVVRSMKARNSGIIINIASTAGQRGEANHSHYAASKGGIIALTKSLAVELAPYGIRVNSISPGWVDTRMVSRVLDRPRLRAAIRKSIPRGRIATPDEIAGPVLFLASDLSKHLIGADLPVNGGSVLV